jgi:hypothetical protein
MTWRILVAAALVGVGALVAALLAAIEGWLSGGPGFARVALHAGLLGAGAALFARGLALRRRGMGRQGALALGLLAAVTLPYAALLGAAVWFFVLSGERI